MSGVVGRVVEGLVDVVAEAAVGVGGSVAVVAAMAVVEFVVRVAFAAFIEEQPAAATRPTTTSERRITTAR
jgi:hypothetical protein